MPAPTVTVFASTSIETSSRPATATNRSVLSAIPLKLWRVPSTFIRACAFTQARTASPVAASSNACVLYAMFPAQLFIFPLRIIG